MGFYAVREPTKQAILEDLKRVLAGQTSFRVKDYLTQGGRFSSRTVYDACGTWGEALYLAGVITVKPPVGRNKKPDSEPMRQCNNCPRTFQPEGPYNRTCPQCKQTDAWR